MFKSELRIKKNALKVCRGLFLNAPGLGYKVARCMPGSLLHRVL